MTIIQRKTKPSKKITYLLKECRNEMNEMKCELFDIQTALNACRTSLKTLNISDGSNVHSRDLSTDSTHFAPILNSTKKSKTTKKSSKQKRKHHQPNNSIFSSSLDSESVLSSSHTSLAAESSTYTYPSSSSYFKNQFYSHYHPMRFNNKTFKNRSIRNYSKKRIIGSTKTPTMMTTDDYSACLSNYKNSTNSRSKKYAHNTTPIRCQELTNSRRNFSSKHNNYNTIQVFNHYGKPMSLSYCKTQNRKRPSLFEEVPCSEKKMIEKSYLKFPQYTTPINRNMSPISVTNKSEKSNRNSNLAFSKPKSLKDHFLVINHKVESNQTIFEPKASSTPIKKNPKTSTPNQINNSYFENILVELESNSKKYNRLMSLKAGFNSKDSNKHSDYFSSSTHIEDNDYDVPEPRSHENEYQVPSSFIHNQFDSSYENSNENNKTVNYRNQDQNLAFTSTPVKTLSTKDFQFDRIKDESENLTKITTLKSNNFERRDSMNYMKSESIKNVTILSNASSVRSSVVKCCIKPFRILYLTKNMKKVSKKL